MEITGRGTEIVKHYEGYLRRLAKLEVYFDVDPSVGATYANRKASAAGSRFSL